MSPDRNKASSAQNFPWPIFAHAKGKEFIDFDEDLQIKDIQRAVAEGYDDLELVKRYSTVVMGPSQGRQSALNNLRIVTKAAKEIHSGIKYYHPKTPVSSRAHPATCRPIVSAFAPHRHASPTS